MSRSLIGANTDESHGALQGTALVDSPPYLDVWTRFLNHQQVLSVSNLIASESLMVSNQFAVQAVCAFASWFFNEWTNCEREVGRDGSIKRRRPVPTIKREWTEDLL